MPLALTRSRVLQQRAERFLPGGVDSPARAFLAVGGDPPFVERGEGAYLWDVDGNRYIDYFGSWGPMILGHAFPPVIEAVREAATCSTSFGASTASEADLAELVTRAFPSIDKLRFVSSGTEATMSAIRLARAFTGRKLVVKFQGCYHGHSDGLLVKAGSGVATLGIPGSAGVPDDIAHLTLALPYNDAQAVEETFSAHPHQIACIIVEPVVGNAGCILPASGYLEALREITNREGALLIFDEVMTGFRVAVGGAQELYGISPDLTTLGKIVGGGLPCAAFGGRADIMNLLAPLGSVYQAGTLSGNPLAMAAGIATIGHLLKQHDSLYPLLESVSEAVVSGILAEASRAGVPMVANRVGAMFTWFFTSAQVVDYNSAALSDTAAFARFHRAMLEQGVWLPCSQFEAAFISAAHTLQDVQLTVDAARVALQSLAPAATSRT